MRRITPAILISAALAAIPAELRGGAVVGMGTRRQLEQVRYDDFVRKALAGLRGGPGTPTHSPNGGGRRKAEMARRHARKYGKCRMGRYHA